MELYIGGAYQGKRECACARHYFREEQIYLCGDGYPDFFLPCVASLERFTLWCVRNDVDAVEFFQCRKEDWKDHVLICEDISCGVVPIEPELRKWREMNGRLCLYLAKEAEAVYRVLCGLEQRLK